MTQQLAIHRVLSTAPLNILSAAVGTGETPGASFVEDARKVRLQLTRARKDLRELWMERDELATLAGQAMQARGAASYE